MALYFLTDTLPYKIIQHDWSVGRCYKEILKFQKKLVTQQPESAELENDESSEERLSEQNEHPDVTECKNVVK